MRAMPIQNERLLALIDYVEATERDRMAIVTDVADYRGLRADGADVARMPGVRVDARTDDDPVWLSVDRLARHAPSPPAEPELALWIDQPDDVDTRPTLHAARPAAALRKAGLVATADLPAGNALVPLVDYPHRERLVARLADHIRETWTGWALEEKPRRRAIAFYNALFGLRQALDGGGTAPVELVWGIGPARWAHPAGRLHHPLLSVAMDLTIDPVTHAILLRPRSATPPGIESDPLDALELPGVDQWRRTTQATLDALAADEDRDGLNPFDPDGFAPILRHATALFDADGLYLPERDGMTPPAPTVLTVGGGWMLFERTRRATMLMDDLRAFRTLVANPDDPADIPPAVRALLTDPDTALPAAARPIYRGVSTVPGVTSSDGSGDDLFFPKPFNREQVEVIQQLATRPGVVVQGPPGTGKTHSIANIVSHYLALGKRVLVTSQKAPALKVLRAQLPAAVRPLAVSLLESDRDGLRQFQESVDIIAERLQRIRPAENAAQVAAIDATIDRLHRGLAQVDAQVADIGRAATAAVTIDGATIDPATAAREQMADRALAAWLPDPIDVIRSHEAGYDDADIVALRTARKAVGARLDALGLVLPTALPDDDALLALHDALAHAEAIRRSTPTVAALAPDATPERLADAARDLVRLADLRRDIADGPHGWTATVLADLRRGHASDGLVALEGLVDDIDHAVAEARHFLTRPVDLPDGALDDAPLRDRVTALAQGHEPGFLTGLFARALGVRVAAIRLVGHPPAGPSDWAEVDRHLAACDAVLRLRAAWNNAAAHSPLEPVAATGLGVAEPMRRQLARIALLRTLVDQERRIDPELRALVPGWRGSVIRDDAATSAIAATLDRHRQRLRLLTVQARHQALRAMLAPVGGTLGDGLRAAAERVGNPDADADMLRADWRALLAERDALAALGAHYAAIARVTDLIAESGATIWADRLRSDPVTGVDDPLTPGDWRHRWRLRRIATWLTRIDRHGALAQAGQRRTELEGQLRRAYAESIELRSWGRLAEQASDQVRAALASYAQAMRRIGRGTGIKAGRYRHDARIAADRAKAALPCWIMPHYRVSESLPAELGLFDLVIVDEASQSTVAALPALLRAKQVLIVGDDRQVTPDAGFRAEARMNELAQRHLAGQVPDYRAVLREEKSLYDLGTVVFAGGAIMLKEHFRCVAPIIEYSKAQFYSHQLVPLRLPSASQRLDPPLIDILVEDGVRRGKTNPAEVDCIVEEIGRIVADPAMAGRSIGVTTLLGHEQAAALFAAIERTHGVDIMLAHDIRIGEPSAFQGDERDIMFVSMVADRGSSALSGAAYDQRFNVAASRARDRMILVRSVEPEDLKPADQLRRALIDHFRAPFVADPAVTEAARDRCESGFEREMFDLIVQRGYRVDTQVRVGAARIDMVVEGADDRRLAIECDGDMWHGADRWPDDMARQRMLERAGWAVWRCFASRFVRDRDAAMADLVATLTARDIHPVAHGQDRPATRHTEHRRWRPGGNEPVEAPAAEHVPYAHLVPMEAF
ncbi:AAA domain-containing protein [Sphingomonas montana]|uniref:AAA domain-containing protein n=1 Tax=Sphingomonas montana TaxID=1843236 RepID=UPI001F0B451D|nr:AAA domain-containing protein [Sphingomonas montana]